MQTISWLSSRRNPMGTRRKSRECALQVLFQWDIHGHTEHGIEGYWEQQQVAPDTKAFADRLVYGVMAHHEELDNLIESHATNWSIERMPVVDRNILRLSLYELLWVPDIPAKVTVNEGLELSKSFADEEARRFINGILDKVFKEDARLDKKRTEVTTDSSSEEEVEE